MEVPSSKGTCPEFVSRLEQWRDTGLSERVLTSMVLNELFDTVAQEDVDVFQTLERSLIDIGTYLYRSQDVRAHSQYWQRILGRWRPFLHAMSNIYNSTTAWAEIMSSPPSEVPDQDSEKFAAERLDRFKSVKFSIDNVLRDFESICTAIMATMSIIESEKAIQEAEYVTKLAQLAFFFIPLSYVAGVCGLNVKIIVPLSTRNPRADTARNSETTASSSGHGGLTSLAMLGITYLVFYFRIIMHTIADVPSITKGSWQWLRKNLPELLMRMILPKEEIKGIKEEANISQKVREYDPRHLLE